MRRGVKLGEMIVMGGPQPLGEQVVEGAIDQLGVRVADDRRYLRIRHHDTARGVDEEHAGGRGLNYAPKKALIDRLHRGHGVLHGVSNTSRTLRARTAGVKGFCRKLSPGSSIP